MPRTRKVFSAERLLQLGGYGEVFFHSEFGDPLGRAGILGVAEYQF